MNAKSVALCLGALAAWPIGSIAQESAPAPAESPPSSPATVVVTSAYVSQYMFRGERLGGQAIEPSVEVDLGHWAAGVWSNVPLDDTQPDHSDREVDPYASYTFDLTDSLGLQPGFSWYTYPWAPVGDGYYRMTFEPYFGVDYSIGNLKLTPKLYYDVVLDGPTYEFNAAYAVPLRRLGTELDFAGTLGTYLVSDDFNKARPEVKAWGNYWLLGVSMPFSIAKAATLAIGWTWADGSGAYIKQGSAPKFLDVETIDRGVFSLTFTWTR